MRLSIVVAALALGACGNWKSVYRVRSVSAGQERVSAFTMDALQRNVVVRFGSSADAIRICAERSPDVFSVLAAAAKADANVDVAKQLGSLGVGFSATETGAVIKRSQAANLLGESLYRTCERWLNEAATPAEMAKQANRDSFNLIAALAIEQLTSMGTPQPPQVIISGGSANASGGGSAVVTLQNSHDAAARATAARVAADAKLAVALGKGNEGKTCATAGLTDEDKIKACEAAKQAADTAKKQEEDLNALYQAQLKAASADGAVTVGGGSGTVTPVGGGAQVDSETARAIVDAVVEIAKTTLEYTREQSQEELSRQERRGVFSFKQNEKVESGGLLLGAALYTQVASEEQIDPIKKIIAKVGFKQDSLDKIKDIELRQGNSPNTSVVRYYDEQGWVTASALSAKIGAFLGISPKCEDFSENVRRLPSPGVIELWIGVNAKLNPDASLKTMAPGVGCKANPQGG